VVEAVADYKALVVEAERVDIENLQVSL
jgi:hypothetical protein